MTTATAITVPTPTLEVTYLDEHGNEGVAAISRLVLSANSGLGLELVEAIVDINGSLWDIAPQPGGNVGYPFIILGLTDACSRS